MHHLIKQTHPQWQPLLSNALNEIDTFYLENLEHTQEWFPGINNLFAAFSRPLDQTRYILLGESPYPRSQSANGYAFWDNAIGSLWSEGGFSKEVNRATSLRNWLKALLRARGDLKNDLSQAAIASLDKTFLCQTAQDFFNSLLNKGFLLLNASLVFSKGEVPLHARNWRPFMNHLFEQLAQYNPAIKLILFGNIAKKIQASTLFSCVVAEHPYNVSFIKNPVILDFFRPFNLLASHE